MARADYKSVDDYIAAQSAPEIRSVLERVRATIRKRARSARSDSRIYAESRSSISEVYFGWPIPAPAGGFIADS